MKAQLLFSDHHTITKSGEVISSRAASSQRPEKYSVAICDHEHPCPTIQCLNTAYNEDNVKIQSKTEQKVDIVAFFEMGWRISWGRRAGKGWNVGQRGSLVQTEQKHLRGAWELPLHLHSNCTTD